LLFLYARCVTQYFELDVNHGIYHDGWMASALSFPPWQSVREGFDPDKQKWELYNINEDFTQANDLAAQQPAKLRQLQTLWWIEAAKYNVLPLDWRGANPRMNAEIMGRPSLIAGRKTMTYYPGTVGLPDAAAPPVLNKSWTITADIDLPNGNESGIIITQGGITGGYGLYLRDGKPMFVYNYLALERPMFAAKDPLPQGKTALVVDFQKYRSPLTP
jgi:arylsulfatase